MKKFGLKVNDSKTELCFFYKHDTVPVTMKINGNYISSITKMNALGVLFDMKLTWHPHVSTKASKSLIAIKLLGNFFTFKEQVTS
jgi:hypothetical protein